MLKTVLVPLDGSKTAEHALDVVKTVLPPGGNITLLTVVPDNEPMPAITLASGEQVALDTHLLQLEHRLRIEGYQANVEIRQGSAAEVILETALALGVEIIAMSSSGHGGLERLLFGSVTQKVLAEALCPVLVVPDRVRDRLPESVPETPDLSPGLVT